MAMQPKHLKMPIFMKRLRRGLQPRHYRNPSTMQPAQKLLILKVIHTLIWAFFVCVIAYVVYSGITNQITSYTWVGIGLVIGEGLVLWIFRMFCPLTVLARRYSDSQKDNFDIFLPNWLARNNKLIFTSIFVAGLILVVIRTLMG